MPHAPVLGDLATPVTVIDVETGVGEIEALIRADPECLGLVAVADGTTYVLDRPYLETVLAGRLGYRRALLFRRPARAILRGPALVMPAATAWDDAARAVLNRPSGTKSLPVELKLDRSFVHRIHDPRERAIVEAVAAMARGLRLTLVAEGVEDQQTADVLRETGFDVLQGYHFGRPAPSFETVRRAA
jgi:hypothetical protein